MSIRLTTTNDNTHEFVIHNKIARFVWKRSYFRIISVPFNNRIRTIESNGIRYIHTQNWIFLASCALFTYIFHTDNDILCIEYGNFADELQKLSTNVCVPYCNVSRSKKDYKTFRMHCIHTLFCLHKIQWHKIETIFWKLFGWRHT